MADIDIDADDLNLLASNLESIAAALERAVADAEAAASTVGQQTLADKIRSFAQSWEIARGELAASVSDLAERVRGTAQSFVELDEQAAQVIGTSVSMAATLVTVAGAQAAAESP